MEKLYKIVFVYPDGHIEEVEDLFRNGPDALEYGNNLLAQVRATEGSYHKNKDEGLFGFGFKKKNKAYFMIVEIEDKDYKMVYDSRN